MTGLATWLLPAAWWLWSEENKCKNITRTNKLCSFHANAPAFFSCKPTFPPLTLCPNVTSVFDKVTISECHGTKTPW